MLLTLTHRNQGNIDCLMARTTCLVWFISTVNGRSKRSLLRAALVAGTQQNLSSLYYLDVYALTTGILLKIKFDTLHLRMFMFYDRNVVLLSLVFPNFQSQVQQEKSFLPPPSFWGATNMHILSETKKSLEGWLG